MFLIKMKYIKIYAYYWNYLNDDVRLADTVKLFSQNF